jgi:hypothetical protein
VYCFYQLQAHPWLSSRIEAGIPDDFVQFLGDPCHLAQLNCNRMQIPRRRSTRATQNIDADHVLKRLDGAEGSFCLDPYPVHLVPVPVA